MEPFTGAWHRNIRYENKESLLRYSAIYACVTGISADIGKLRIKLCIEDSNGIWNEVKENQPWLPVLRRPNHYQNRIEFLEQWAISKLLHGNAYILKEREDKRGIVTALYPLNPMLVKPVVLPDGAIYYQISADHLSKLEDSVVVPASEIIHDRMPALWHPLVGVPPLYACVLSGTLGNRIMKHAIKLFDGRAMPGGTIEIPGELAPDKIEDLKKKIDEGYSGENIGKIMVLTSGMKFNAIEMMTSRQAELADQLKLTVEDIARAFHYPLFKLGGPVPALAGNVDALITTYYSDCLQTLIEKVELCLDEGLDLPAKTGTELDLDNLMRLDIAALYESNDKGVNGGWLAPNEARFRANYRPATGGDSPFLQQQYWSLEQLAKRDSAPAGISPTEPEVPPEPKPLEPDEEEKKMIYEGEINKALEAA